MSQKLKDFFAKESRPYQIKESISSDELGREVESPEYLQEIIKQDNRFLSTVDFSTASNFVKFGSARKYYVDSIERIHKTYPYDGSLREKTKWLNESSYLDLYIYNDRYPRSTGYAVLSAEGWSTRSSATEGYGVPGTLEYISLYGGPHKDPDTAKKIAKKFPSPFDGDANIWDEELNRRSNLAVSGNLGNTIETWVKVGTLNKSTFTDKQIIFDLWRSGSLSSSAGYGRVTLELSASSTDVDNYNLTLTAQSGTAGVFQQALYDSAVITTGSWNHIAVSYINSGSNLKIYSYLNGELKKSFTAGTTIGEFGSGSIAYLGALVTAPSGNAFHGTTLQGAGKLSGSVDEFRFWTKRRDTKQIVKHWRSQVGGGTNTDNFKHTGSANAVDLGVYYKFNEGITGITATDSVVLDYSGRLSNGTWTGYTATSRNTGSAIVSASAAISEFRDPVIYSSHPDVIALSSSLSDSGSLWDYQNNSSIYNSLPHWITEQENGTLTNIIQIMSSYFDTLALQIDELPRLGQVNYVTDGEKPYPFVNKMLESRGLIVPEIFVDADVLERFQSRNETRQFKQSLFDTKNEIYQNIYNNLSYIYKSKGTEKAYRNLIRCYGVDDELIKINLYANNETFTLEENTKASVVKKHFVNFTDNHEGSVFQITASGDSNTRSYIAGTLTNDTDYGIPMTFETEVIFPYKHEPIAGHGDLYKSFPQLSASLFGVHTAQATNTDTNYTWSTTTAATATIEFTGAPDPTYGYSNYITIVSSDGTSRTYVTHGSQFGPANSNDLAFGVGTAASPNAPADIAAGLKQCIEIAAGHNGKITVTRDGAKLTLTQATAGADGNTTFITTLSNTTTTNFTNGADEDYDFQVYAVRDKLNSPHCYFQLTSSNGVFPNLTSSLFYNVYDNNEWNFAVRVKPSSYPLSNKVSGSDSYIAEFVGVNANTNVVENEFIITGSMTQTNARNFLNSSKRLYIGAHLTNFTGSTITRADTRVSSPRVWMNYLDNDAIRSHAKNSANYGAPSSYKSAFNSLQTTLSGTEVSPIETLALNWEFATVTTSDSSGEFTTKDASSGSTELASRYGWLGSAAKYQHPGRAINFQSSDTGSIAVEYLYSAKQKLPEIMNSSDMINVLSEDDDYFTREHRPITYYISFEKSMYQTISEEMINVFASILDYNNLIGEPVHRYRQSYKQLAKLKQLFFERIDNTPDLDKYVDFYKWIDTSMYTILEQLTPVSANISETLQNVVESHVLERNKYWTKFPTIEVDPKIPETTLLGINELSYNWKYGHAPVATVAATALIITCAESALQDTKDFTLTNAAGVTTTYNISTGLATTDNDDAYTPGGSDGRGPSGTITIGVLGTTTAADVRDEIITRINAGTSIDFTASASGDNVLVTQGTAGSLGNTTITEPDGSTGLTLPSAFTGGENEESRNCLWWKERAERGGAIITSGDANVDSDRDTIVERITSDVSGSWINNTLAHSGSGNGNSSTYLGSTYALRRLSRPLKLEINRMRKFGGGSNPTANKNSDFHRSLLNTRFPRNEDSRLQVHHTTNKGFDYNDACNDDEALLLKRRLKFKVSPTSENAEGQDYFNGDDFLLPFSLFSASVGNIDFKDNVVIANYHDDIVPGTRDVPLQGPFTEKYVGGWQYRHTALNCSSSAKSLDDETTRGEGFRFKHASDTNLILTSGQRNAGAVNASFKSDYPKASLLRDESAKRSVNIRNIKQTTGSCGTVIGNYEKEFNVVKVSSGRANNNVYFKNSNGLPNPSIEVTKSIVYDKLIIASGVGNDEGFKITVPKHLGGRGITITVILKSSMSADPAETEIFVKLEASTSATAANLIDAINGTDCITVPCVETVKYGTLAGLQGSGILGISAEEGRTSSRITLTVDDVTKDGDEITFVDLSTPDIVQSVSFERVLVNLAGWSGHINGLVDFKLPDRGRNEHVIVNRFSAPGGPEINARGALDIESEEYSAYNALPYRNLSVRQPLRTLLSRHTAQFGYDSVWSSPSASFHKTNMNPLDRYEITNAYSLDDGDLTSVAVNKSYSNYWIQREMPADTLQYTWITASYSSSYVYGHPSADGWYSSSADGFVQSLQFITGSDITVGGNIVDFAGLNTLIYDPVTSSLNILSASDNSYINTSIGTLTTPQSINALLLHRNGPYQYPSWKQTRTGENAVVRHQRRNNLISLNDKSKTQHELIVIETPLGTGTKLVFTKETRLNRQFTEPALTSKFKPLDHTLFVKEYPAAGETLNPMDVLKPGLQVRSTYGNNFANFANTELRNLTATRGQVSSEQIYDKLLALYTDKNLSSEENSIESFGKLVYRETVYPKEINTYLGKIRGRTSYSETTSEIREKVHGQQRTFWRDSATDRLRKSGSADTSVFTSSLGYKITGSAYSDPDITAVAQVGVPASIWPLECEYAFPNRANLVIGGSATTTMPNGTDSSRNGELSWYNGWTFSGSSGLSNIGTASLQYDYFQTHPRLSTAAGSPYTASYNYVADWTANTDRTRSRNPWYDSYDDYVSDIRVMGQDHTVLPEFRVSEHMESYLENNDFAPQTLSNTLTIEGGYLADSSVSDFAKVFSHTDFMKHFDVIKKQHVVNGYQITNLTLQCYGVKKFLPYQGFYPVTRTMQLGTLFSQSYGDEIRQANGSTSDHAGRLQAALQPYMAPGILYNSIKSGIAVDWPMVISDYEDTITTMIQQFGLSYDIDGFFSNVEPNYRLPFESLYNPTSGKNSFPDEKAYYLNVTHPTVTYLAGGLSSADRRYSLAMNNFLAESVRFFLKDGKLTSFQSTPGTKTVDPNKTYYMDVVITTGSNFVSYEGPRFPSSYDNVGRVRSVRGIHYGPAFATQEIIDTEGSTKDQNFVNRSDPAFAPYTPPYFYGTAIATLKYTPDADELGGEGIPVSAIIANVENNGIEYKFLNESAPIFDTANGDASKAATHRMNLGASIDFFGKSKAKIAQYDPATGTVLDVQDTFDDKSDKWVINTKYECPVFSHEDYDNTVAGSGGFTWPTDTFTRGTWKTYGKIPSASDNNRLELKLRETFPKEVLNNSAVTGSLIELMGFDRGGRTEAQIGQLAGGKKVFEAIVAIPIYGKDNKFVPLVDASDRELDPTFPMIDHLAGLITLDSYENIVKNAGNDKPFKISKSIANMVGRMQKYVIPPQFDFVTPRIQAYKNLASTDRHGTTLQVEPWRHPTLAPFVMYIFEFEHRFTQGDLQDIWQGIMPESGTKAEKVFAEISHDIKPNELMGYFAPEDALERKSGLPDDLRWIVFKVKQKATTDYSAVVDGSKGDDGFKPLSAFYDKSDVPYSYNWPYDFFSLIELAKIDAHADIGKIDISQLTNVEGTTTAAMTAGQNTNLMKPLKQ